MTKRIYANLIVLAAIGGMSFIVLLSSCGKSGVTNAAGLNIEYHILNLSPDLGQSNLFVDFKQQNRTPFIYGVDQGYFYVTSLDTPYQIRTVLNPGVSVISRGDILKPNIKYTLFITGIAGNSSLRPIFTIDTAALPAVGRGKVRFVNASPTATDGLDITANGTIAFSKVTYSTVTKYIELPIGNYDFKVNLPGSTTVLKDLPAITIQDGRLYTLYAYGFTNRVDTAAFNAGVITNR